MAYPDRLYAATASKGIYYTDAFTASGDQPVYGTINGGLDSLSIGSFCPDRSLTPQDGRMFCVAGGDIYRRTTGDWVEVLSAAEIVAMTAAGQAVCGIVVDPITGYVHAFTTGKPGELDFSAIYSLRSVDHGDNWTATNVATHIIAIYGYSNIDAYAGSVVFADSQAVTTSIKIRRSTDSGVTWATTSGAATGAVTYETVTISQADGMAYGNTGDGDGVHGWKLDPSNGSISYPAAQDTKGVQHGNLWLDPTDAYHGCQFDGYYRESTDDFATWDTENDGISDDVAIIADDCEYGAWVHGRHAEPGAHIYISMDGYTLTARSGANHGMSPYTDSIPDDAGGIIKRGLWAVFDPPTEGPTPPPGSEITPPDSETPVTLGGDAYVQGVSMPDYTGEERGIPLPSDRSAWDTIDYKEYHARDIRNEVWSVHVDPEHPVPHTLDALDDVDTDGVEDGDALLYDGEMDTWKPAAVLTPDEHTAIGNDSPHHAAVTLDPASDVALEISGQVLKLTMPETTNKYRQYTYIDNGDSTWSFVTNGDGMPVFALLELE